VNYRHAFHAGNFADLVKHAALIALLQRLTADPSPLTVVDTHAGAGLYDLSDPAQARSREAEAGVKRLLTQDVAAPLRPLRDAVVRRNPDGGVRVYPGSPALILDALRPPDRYVACELEPDVFLLLQHTLRGAPNAQARARDGYPVAIAGAGRPGRLFVLIDPPFERPDDYARTASAVAAIALRKPDAVVLVWLPLKDLETLDGFVRRLETGSTTSTVVAEARLRPLRDPMKMNGCALVAVNAPVGYAAELEAICAAVVSALGEPDGGTKLWSP
jgi:23S rRNA (adenine2030-N6)-methyltransferase